jgi:uncharacterized protein
VDLRAQIADPGTRIAVEKMTRSELLSSELDRLVRIVSTRMNPDQIVVFGSFATGEVREWSDLDVVIVMDTNLPYLERLRSVLREVVPAVTVDLFVYTPLEWVEIRRTRPFVRDEIGRKGIVIYERPWTALG